jgi:hypothetical protein
LNRESIGKALLLTSICLINCFGAIIAVTLSGFSTINLSSEAKFILGGSVSTIDAFNYLINFFLYSSFPIIIVDSWTDYNFLPYEKNKLTKHQIFLWSSLTNIIGKFLILLCMNIRLLPIILGITIVFIIIFYLLGLIKPVKSCLSWIFGTQARGKLCRGFHNLMGTLFCLFWLTPFFWFIAVQFINQNFKTGELGNYAFFISFYVAMLVVILRLISSYPLQRDK